MYPMLTNDVFLDIDECSTSAHNCTQNQQCVNMPGTFICECVSGYRFSGGTCKGNDKLMYVADQ